MIKENGIRAFEKSDYDYYELLQDFGVLEKGAVFVHDRDDKIYGSIMQGCLKLCWNPEGNCYGDLCANTVFLHFSFTKDKTFFRKVYSRINEENKEKLQQKINRLESELLELNKELSTYN